MAKNMENHMDAGFLGFGFPNTRGFYKKNSNILMVFRVDPYYWKFPFLGVSRIVGICGFWLLLP